MSQDDSNPNPLLQPTRRGFLQMVVVSAAAGVVGCGDDDDGSSSSNNTTGTNNNTTDTSNNTTDTSNNTTDTSNGTTGGVSSEEAFPQGVASGDPSPTSVILWTRVEPTDAATAETVQYDIATDEMFTNVLTSGELMATAESDHTLRLKVTDLEAYTTYYYRFTARGATSPIGRTKTAPSADQDVPVRFAFASCQDFNGRYYHAWDLLTQEDPEVDFVLFLGDYIYETTGDPRFQETAPERVVEIPEGLVISEDGQVKAALTLNDYRGLYKQYRGDAALREVHRLYPFVCIWDDHEFADDSWQDHATHFNEEMGNEKDTMRRTMANQAWFEYQPADVTRNASAMFPDDMTIYRTLRFGAHMELVLTDQRSYRDDHVIPEGPSEPSTGKVGVNTAVGSRNFVLKAGFDIKEAEAVPTMLGSEQRTWLEETLKGSDATWKMWGSETQLGQMLVDLSSFEGLPPDFQDVFYFSTDQWDGYRSERAAIMSELAGVENLVVLTGDIHAFYATELQLDFDAPSEPVAVEFIVSGISSTPVQDITRRTVEGDPLLRALGLLELVPRFDELLNAASPHYKYSQSNRNGVAVVDVTAAAVEVTFIEIEDTTNPDTPTPSRTRLRCASGSNTIEVLS